MSRYIKSRNVLKHFFVFGLWFLINYLLFLYQSFPDFKMYTRTLMPENYNKEIQFIKRDSLASFYSLKLFQNSDTLVQAYVRVPESKKNLPVILLLGGMMTGKKAVEFAYGVENAIIVAPDYGYEIEKKYSIWQIIRDISVAHTALHNQVRNNLILINFFSGNEWQSNNKIGILGYSFGVPFALATINAHQEIDNLALVYGGADLYGLIRKNFRSFNTILNEIFSFLFWIHLADFEPSWHAQKIQKLPVLQINGKEDVKIPVENSDLLTQSFQFPIQTLRLSSDHVHPNNVALTIKIIEQLNHWYTSIGFFTNR